MKSAIKITILFLLLLSLNVFSQSQLTVHGYLNQAYAFTNKHQLLGITKDGNANYRNLALQFRYDFNFQNTMVIQMSHKVLGESPFMLIEPELRVDWAFYEYRMINGLSARVGKVQLPLGIFNELRDVGILLPFYRAPFSFYQEGKYMSETVDGIVLSYALGDLDSWSLDFDFYAGQWRWTDAMMDQTGSGYIVKTIKVDKGIGGGIWLNTPITGLRFGSGGHRAHVGEGITFPSQNFKSWYASFDGDFDAFVIRGEFRDLFFQDDLKYESYYGQIGIKFLGKFVLNAQADFSRLRNSKVPYIFGGGTKDMKIHDDYALGINYMVHNNLVLKAETHWTEGMAIEDKLVNFYVEDPYKVNYTILTLSSSF